MGLVWRGKLAARQHGVDVLGREAEGAEHRDGGGGGGHSKIPVSEGSF